MAGGDTAVWSPELADALAKYVGAAQEYLDAGRPENAVNTLEAALLDVPGIPAPRRQAIAGFIRDTVYACARRALQASVPDMRAASAWLERALRTPERGDETEHRNAVRAYAWLLHLAGKSEVAVPYYRLASAPPGADADDLYGQQLAQLQEGVPPASTRSTPTPRASGTRTEPSATVARSPHPLSDLAWRRLRGLKTLFLGHADRALRVFPGPDSPALPRAWALEGALLAALCTRWSVALQFYRRALGGRGFGGLAADDLHRFVFLAVAMRCGGGADTAAVEELVMSQRLPARPPRGMFASLAAYRSWADAMRRWQHRLWVRRALQELAADDDVRHGDAPGKADDSRGDLAGLRRSLRVMMRLQPHVPTSRWFGVWLASTAAPSGAIVPRAKLLRDSLAFDGSARHVLQLSVLAAERFGGADDVVTRLNRLLQRFPHDGWGLARWRAWMTKLADEAVAEGLFKQALFQYVSLVLYLPDDADGWRGCAKVLELMGDDTRAGDCRRQAARADARIPKAPHPADDRHMELDILRKLLDDANESAPAAAGFPFSEAVLRRAIRASLRAPDVYLRVLLERWAAGPTNFPRVG